MVDLFELDHNFQPGTLIDSFESLVWAERYASHGDFTLTLKAHYLLTENIRMYKYLAMSETNRVMMVETADIQKQEDGEDLVTLTGRSFEAFLTHRDSKRGDLRDPEYFQGTTGGAARYFVNRYCIDPVTAGSVNVVPGLSIASAPPGETIHIWVDRENIYDMVKKICDSDQLGFMIRRETAGNLVFQVYRGLDKSDPTSTIYREYSVEDGTLIAVSSIESVSNYKNHARVLGNGIGTDVYAPGTSSSVSGFERRTMVVDFSDVTDVATLASLGLKALAEKNNRYVKLIDGEIPQNAWNDTFFGLGDIVMVRDKYGNRTKSMITERIWTVDNQGIKYLPTFEAL